MKRIQSKRAFCRAFLKRRLGNPFIQPLYQTVRKHLARNSLFILCRRSLLRRKYRGEIARIDPGTSGTTAAERRPDRIPLLLKKGENPDPLTIGFIITENRSSTIYGDYFTARGLGDELSKYGYRIVYLPERPVYEWHRLSSIDILVVMIHSFDPFLLRHYPGITSVAWIRGYVDEWCRTPWFKEYDIVLTTSERALAYTRRFAAPAQSLAVLRLAADTEVFRPGPRRPAYACDLSFVGNIFDVPREFTRALTLDPGVTFSIYGELMNPNHPFRAYHRAQVPHGEIPKVYNSSRIVLEDCTPMCRPWGCINSRTFEAMACGACVVSNQVPGLKELFGNAILTYRDRTDLHDTITGLLADEEKRREIGKRAREEIVRHHTYRHRAEEFREIVARHFGIDSPGKSGEPFG